MGIDINDTSKELSQNKEAWSEMESQVDIVTGLQQENQRLRVETIIFDLPEGQTDGEGSEADADSEAEGEGIKPGETLRD